MPLPGSSEILSDFIERCIPIVINDGSAGSSEQAYAICNSIYHREAKKEVLALLADDCLKIFTPEAIILSAALKSSWGPRASAFLEDLNTAIDFTTGNYQDLLVQEILEKHWSPMGEGFIGEVLDSVSTAMDRAFTSGVKKTVVAKSITDDLMQVTGKRRVQVVNSMNRWFEFTQGKYFDRFLRRETLRLKSSLEEHDPAVLREIRNRYVKFVKADGYWDAVSEFDTRTSSVWAQVDVLRETDYRTFVIRCIKDSSTCLVCLELCGLEYSVDEADDQVTNMLSLGAEEAALNFPWPREGDGPRRTTLLPPYHPACRCYLFGKTKGRRLVSSKDLREFRETYSYAAPYSDDHLSEILGVCFDRKALRRDCVDLQSKNIGAQVVGDIGEQIAQKVLGLSTTTTHKHPGDLIAQPGEITKGYAVFEVKSKELTKVEHAGGLSEVKCAIGANAKDLKMSLIRKLKADVSGMIGVVISPKGVADLYYRAEIGAYRFNSMEFVGRAQWTRGEVTFDPSVRDRLLRLIKRGKQ